MNLSVLIIALLVVQATDDTPRVDKAREKLDVALARYDKSLDEANASVLAKLQTAKDRAQKAGDLTLLQAIEKEISKFNESREIPKSISTRSYLRETKRALARVENAYELAIREYTKGNKVETAKQLKLELDDIRKSGTFTSDLLRVGTVWISADPPRRFTVLSRTGNTFQARFQVGDKIDRYITGTTDKTTLSWVSADVVVKSGQSPGGDSNGTFVRGAAGSRIDMSWSGPGDASGEFTLQLATQ